MAQPKNQLTADEYITWSKRAAWSESDAAHLLSGRRPPKRPVDILKIDWLVENIRNVCKSSRECPAEDAHHPQNWIRIAFDWVALDWELKSDAMTNWDAIFPFARSQSLASIFDEEPDYREFSFAFLRDVEMELGKLVSFALGLPGDRFDMSEHSLLLRTLAKQCGAEGLPLDELGSVAVNVRSFVRNHPQDGSDTLNSGCLRWSTWVEEHAELDQLLRLPNIDDGAVTGRNIKPSLRRRAEGRRAAISLLRGANPDVLEDNRQIMELLERANVAEEVKREPQNYELCYEYIQVNSFKNGNFAERYPTLGKDWPDFRKDETVMKALQSIRDSL